MKTYVFSQAKNGKETILYSSTSNNSRKSEEECVAWVKENCVEFADHWEYNGEWVGLTN
jgi:hypothetical protein